MSSLLPVDTWRRIIGIHPWHFWGMSEGVYTPITSGCNSLTFKYSWQSQDALGRSEVEDAIENAERRIFGYLRYWPAPRYTVQTFQWPRYPDRRVDMVGYMAADGRWQTINLNESYVQAAGVETRTLIDDDVTVTYSDEDGDGLEETFTLTASTTVTDVGQIAVYFSSADRLDSDPVSEKYRIRPIKVSIASGTVTIIGRKWLCVRPVLYEGVNRSAVNPTIAGNFATTLDVYRIFLDPTGITTATAQGKLLWETRPFPYYAQVCDPTNNSTDPAAIAEAVARVGIRDSKLGIVSPAEAVYNATSGVWCSANCDTCRPPDRVVVRYQAGYPLNADNEMDQRLRRAVAYLAAADMTRPICACDAANRSLYHWQFDLARTGGAGDENYTQISPNDLDNPFGTRRGHVLAWNEVKNLAIRVGFSPIALP